MLVSSPRLASRHAAACVARRGGPPRRAVPSAQGRFSSSTTSSTTTTTTRTTMIPKGTVAVTTTTTLAGLGIYYASQNMNDSFWYSSPFQNQNTMTTPRTAMAARIPSSGDVVSMGTLTKEPHTGILFPPLCNGLSLVGVGVRIKYVFVKVYAVGTYLDPIAMRAVQKSSVEDIQKALLDPTYPRTIRIVMNRGLSIDKYTAAIVESIEPRLHGQELHTLEEFKTLNPPVDLIEGAEIEMTIRGDTLLYKNAVGGVGSLKSKLFCAALCDIYYGADPVSPGHKESVLEGIKNM